MLSIRMFICNFMGGWAVVEYGYIIYGRRGGFFDNVFLCLSGFGPMG